MDQTDDQRPSWQNAGWTPPATEHELAASKASYADNFVAKFRGTPDQWAAIGQVNLKFNPKPGEYFMRLNTKAWSSDSRRCDPEILKELRAVHPTIEALWNGATKSWIIVGVEQRGPDRMHDLLKVLHVHPRMPERSVVIHIRRRWFPQQPRIAVSA